MPLLLCAAAFVFASPASASDPSERNLKRTDDSELIYYINAPGAEHFPLVVYIQDGRCSSVWPAFDEYRSTIASLGAAFLAVEGRGLRRSGFWNRLGFCPGAFRDHDSLGDRLLDDLQVVQALRAGLSGWDRRIFWIGRGEGGEVAVQLAPMAAETSALTFLASGGGLSATEALAVLEQKELKGRGASQDRIDRAMGGLERQIRLIRDQPESRKKWRGRTYKWWASLFAVNTLATLEHITGPFYMAHGTEDRSIPIESADLIAERYKALGKTNLTYARYDGLDHDWRDMQGNSQKQKVIGDMLRWIQAQIRSEK